MANIYPIDVDKIDLSNCQSPADIVNQLADNLIYRDPLTEEGPVPKHVAGMVYGQMRMIARLCESYNKQNKNDRADWKHHDDWRYIHKNISDKLFAILEKQAGRPVYLSIDTVNEKINELKKNLSSRADQYERDRVIDRNRKLIVAGGAAAFTTLVTAAGVGVATMMSAATDTTATDNSSQFDDATLHPLDDTQRESLKQAMTLGDNYYVPFVQGLMQVSDNGIAPDGSVTSDQTVMVADLTQTINKLHDLVDNGKVYTYVPPEKPVNDLTAFNYSSAVYDRDRIVLQDKFFTESNELEILLREPGDHSMNYGDYLGTLIHVADTIVQLEINDATTERGWIAPTSADQKQHYADSLRYKFEENEPYDAGKIGLLGIDSYELLDVIVHSNLLELGNNLAKAEYSKLHPELIVNPRSETRRRPR